MKTSGILILFVLGHTLILQGQVRFAKILDFGQKPQNAIEILSYNDKFLLGYTGVFVDDDQELLEIGSGILRIDAESNIFDSILVKNFSTGIKSLVLNTMNDKIHFCGEKYIKNGYPQEFTVHEIEKAGLDIDFSYKVKYFDDNQINYFYKVAELIGRNLFLIGSSRNKIDESIKTLIFKLNENEIDTSILVDLGRGTLSWSSLVNKNNNIVVSYMVGDIGKNIVHVIEYDSDLNEVWHYTSENTRTQQLPYLCELENETLVVALSDPNHANIAILRCINNDKTLAWQFRFTDNNGKILRKVNKVKKLKNGDIICMGSYGNLNLTMDTRILQVPYVFRVSSTGQLLWERAFYRDRPVLDYCNGSLRDIVELENGELLAVGRLDNYLEYDSIVGQGRVDPDIFIVRMDSRGCIDDNCALLTKVFPDTTISTVNPTATYEEAMLYPNPSNGSMELLNNRSVSKLSFYSTQGLLIKKVDTPDQDITLTEMPSGLYIVNILLKSGKIIKQKIIIH